MKTRNQTADSQDENDLEIPEEYSIDLELNDIEVDVREIDENVYKPKNRPTNTGGSGFIKFILGLLLIVGIISLIIALGPLWIIAILLFFIFIKK